MEYVVPIRHEIWTCYRRVVSFRICRFGQRQPL